MAFSINRARPDQAGLIFSLICELAEYEKLTHEIEATEAGIADALFDELHGRVLTNEKRFKPDVQHSF